MHDIRITLAMDGFLDEEFKFRKDGFYSRPFVFGGSEASALEDSLMLYDILCKLNKNDDTGF